MRYLMGAVLPALLQLLLVFIIIEANTGNGSWVGLGALLIALFAIPATLLANVLYIAAHKDKPAVTVYARCAGIALIVPLVTPFLFL